MANQSIDTPKRKSSHSEGGEANSNKEAVDTFIDRLVELIFMQIESPKATSKGSTKQSLPTTK